MKIQAIDEFKNLSIHQKINFFDHRISDTLRSFSKSEIYNFLKSIILNSSENGYIRKSALDTLIDLILTKELKIRYGLTILLEDWKESEHIFLELERCKLLFLFYEYEPTEVKNVLRSYLSISEAEIVAECYVKLGMLQMQEALQSESNEKFIPNISESYSKFEHAFNLIENRIDADIFKKITSILLDLANGKLGGTDHDLQSLFKLLIKKDAYTFGKTDNPFLFDIYQSLKNLKQIIESDPKSWTNFKESLDDVYVNYCEVINQDLKNRLNRSQFLSSFKLNLKTKFLEPYFRLNFHGEKKKLDSIIESEDEKTDKYHFLLSLREQLSSNSKKKMSRHSTHK